MTDLPRGVFAAPFDVPQPEKASQTLLSKISDCPFSGALYLRHKGGAQSHAMARGEAIHAAIERLTNLAIEDDEQRIPPEVAKDHMQALLDERTDLALSPLEHEACRVALWNWGADTLLNPASIVCVEQMLELELAGWKIRGKLDRAEIADDAGYVYDYKTGLGYPDQEEFEADFQQQFYGLLLLEGVPEGETVPLGRGLAGVHLTGVLPRITGDEGRMFTRTVYKDRQQIFDFKRTVEAALAKLDHGLAENEWKASPGSHCDFCPARRECPLPERELPDSIATEGQAMEYAERVLVAEAELAGQKKALKAFIAEDGGVLVVGDREFAIRPQESEKVTNREQLYAAMRNAGLEPGDFFTVQRSQRFGHKKVKA